MAKFKIGDHVVSHCDSYGITKTGWMGIVTKLDKYDDGIMYVRGEDRNGTIVEFDVKINDFDLVCNQDKIVITTDGKTTTATHYDGKRVVDKKIAKCSPEDKFDFLTGAAIAFDRLTDREETKKRDLREYLTTGVFGMSEKYGAFVVIGEHLTFICGGFNRISEYSDKLVSAVGDKILYIVDPMCKSFEAAEDVASAGKFVWKRK